MSDQYLYNKCDECSSPSGYYNCSNNCSTTKVCPPGPIGPKGPTGATGATGVTGSTGATGATITQNNAFIVSAAPGSIADLTAIPLATNININGTEITHTAGSTDISLEAKEQYLVVYRAVGADQPPGNNTQSMSLYLNGVALPGTKVSVSIGPGTLTPEITGTAIINTTGTSASILQIRNTSGAARTFNDVQITIVKLF